MARPPCECAGSLERDINGTVEISYKDAVVQQNRPYQPPYPCQVGSGALKAGTLGSFNQLNVDKSSLSPELLSWSSSLLP